MVMVGRRPAGRACRHACIEVWERASGFEDVQGDCQAFSKPYEWLTSKEGGKACSHGGQWVNALM